MARLDSVSFEYGINLTWRAYWDEDKVFASAKYTFQSF